MGIEIYRCQRGCGPIFCCCKLTHYGLGQKECRCRCHQDPRRPAGPGKLRLAKVRRGLQY